MKTRILSMVLGALAVAAVLFLIVELTGFGVGSGDATDETSTISESAGLVPLNFTNVSEYVENGRRKLQISGRGEPEAIIALQDRGENVRQIKVDEDGNWGVILESDSKTMVIEAIMHLDGASVAHRAEETILRIPVPESPEVAAAEFVVPALVLVSAPGTPSRVVQSPFGGMPTQGPLTLGVVDYDDSGGVILSGTTSENGRVRLYAGRAAIGETRVGANGRWHFIAGNMLPVGEYALRAELIRPDKDRVQVSVPFERLPPLKEGTGGEGALSVKFRPYRWQVRQTLIGGGSQSTVVFSPDIKVEDIDMDSVDNPQSPEPELDE